MMNEPYDPYNISRVSLDEAMQGGVPGEEAERHFLYMLVARLLGACDSGSTSGEAFRLSQVLHATLEDMKTEARGTNKIFLLAFAATFGLVNCYQLEECVERGVEPRKFFTRLAQAWREMFTIDEIKLKASGVTEDDLKHARLNCEALKKYLAKDAPVKMAFAYN